MLISRKDEMFEKNEKPNYTVEYGGNIDGIFIVTSIRKSDGKVFQNKRTFESESDALLEARRKAEQCSTDYIYVVNELLPLVSVARQMPPIVVTRLG
jgi:hypothetical protein